MESLDIIINEETGSRECYRGNDFTIISNFDELTKLFKVDYIENIENEENLPNFSVSSNINPDIINLLDAFDDAISKTFKISEPEETIQVNSRKKNTKTRRIGGKGGPGRGIRGSNKKGDLQGNNIDDINEDDIESKVHENYEGGIDQLDVLNDNINVNKVSIIPNKFLF